MKNKDGKPRHVFVPILVMCIVALGIILFIEYGISNQVIVSTNTDVEDISTAEGNEEATKVETQEPMDSKEEIVREPYVAKPVISISPTKYSDYGIELDTSFIVEHIDEVSEEQLMGNLVFETALGKSAFSVSALGSHKYEVTLEKALPENNIVKVKYSYNSELYGYAYETRAPFAVESVYPSDGSDYIKLNTGIEINFNRLIGEEVANYFEISPKTEGSFSVKDYKLIFKPKYKLFQRTSYTISLKEGYSFDDEALEPMSFSFKTEHEYNDVMRLGGEYLVNGMSPDGYQILPIYLARNGSSSIKSLDVYRIDGDVDELLKLRYHDAIMAKIEEGEGTFVKAVDVELEKEDYNQFLVIEETIEKGFYYFVGKDKYSTGCFVQVTDVNAYVTVDEDELLVWVAESGVVDMSGDVYLQDEYIGRTNTQGLLNKKITLEYDQISYLNFVKDNETIYLPTEVRSPTDYISNDYYNYSYTDREIYRTSDTIYASGYIKNRKGEKPKNVILELQYNGEVLQSKDIELSVIGTYEASFEYEAFYQDYLQLVIKINGEELSSRWLRISDFEKPTYVLKASIDKDYVMNGDSFNYTTSMTYYDETPVFNARLNIDYDLYKGKLYDKDNVSFNSKLIIAEKGFITEEFKPIVKTTSWRPSYLSIESSTTNIQNFYDRTYETLLVFPKTKMIELDSTETASNKFKVEASYHKVDISKIEDYAYDPEEFRGEAISNETLSIVINEVYYEKKFLRQEYNAIYKTTYDVYQYIKHDTKVFSGEAITNADGIATFNFDKVIDQRYYYYKVTGIDADESQIIEEGSHGRNNYFYEYEVPFYSLVTKDDNDLYGEYLVDYNEVVELELLKRNESIDEDNDKMLIIEQRDGINHYQLVNGTTVKLTFDESRLPDTYVKAVYFNNTHMTTNYNMGKTLYINRETRKLDIQLTFDKDKYKPGEEVRFDVDVKNHLNKGQAASVNISVVDEAVFAVAEDNSDPLYSLYSANYNRNIIGEFILSTNLENFGGAEQGGEGGPDSIRDDFEDTAYFSHITTNSNGKGSGSFILPDNITSWRVTATAFTKDAQTGKKAKNVLAGLSFFQTLNNEEQYLVGDDIFVSVKTGGEEQYLGTEILLQTLVTNENAEVIVDKESIVKFNDLTAIGLGILPKGKYTIETTVSTGDRVDRIQQEFSVVDYIGRYDLETIEPLKKDFNVTHNNSLVELTIFNKEAWEYFNELDYLTRYDRDDQMLRRGTSYLANRFIEDYFGVDDRLSEIRFYDYFDGNDLIKSLNAASGSYINTCRLFAIGFGDYIPSSNIQRLKEKVSSILNGNMNRASDAYIGSLWLGTLMGDSDYENLKIAYENYEFVKTIPTKMMLIQALLDAGEITKASQLLDRFLWDYDLDLEKSYLTFTSDKEDAEMISLMLLASSIKLEKWDLADRIATYLESKNRNYVQRNMYYVSEPELFMYHSKKEKPVIEAQLNASYNGQVINEVLIHNNQLSLVLTPEEVDSFIINDIVGELMVDKEHIGIKDNLALLESKPIIKTITNNKTGLTDIQIGDVVKVSFTFAKNRTGGGFSIQDTLPAGLSFYRIDKQKARHYLYGNVTGDSFELSGYLSTYGNYSGGAEVTYSYLTIATAQGEYGMEPMYIYDSYNAEHFVSEESRIIIGARTVEE